MPTLFEQVSARVTHLEIELSRATQALKAFVDWHDMDHENELGEDLQAAYERAIAAAKDFVAEQNRQRRMAEEGITEDDIYETRPDL